MEYEEGSCHSLLNKMIMWNSTDSDLLSIIRNSADVNITNHNDEGDTPLHLAVKRVSSTVPLELIKRGADINARGKSGLTPLHRAVRYCNIEAVCLLLYYNVDVTIVSPDNQVAFMYALDSERLEIAYLLLDYHDEFPVCSLTNDTVLHIFARNLNPIAVDLVYKGVDVNCLNMFKDSPITYSIGYDSPNLFKLLWTKIDDTVLYLTAMPFLKYYLERCKFSKDDWVECLYLVLECDKALDLIEHCAYFLPLPYRSFFKMLLPSLNKSGIAVNHRTNIIYAFLALGATVYFSDIDWLVGINYIDDYLMLAYFSTNDRFRNINNHVLSEFFTVTGHPSSYNHRSIYYRFMKQIQNSANCDCLMSSVENAVGYFSLRYAYKPVLASIAGKSNKSGIESVIRRLNLMPEFPSLLEICRNRTRSVIQEKCNITKPYQFYDVLKKLELPLKLKDIVRFKESLYS